jgi:hypothetical protein
MGTQSSSGAVVHIVNAHTYGPRPGDRQLPRRRSDLRRGTKESSVAVLRGGGCFLGMY